MRTLEERVRVLEDKMSCLTGEARDAQDLPPWWGKWFGAFKDDPSFDEAVRLAQEYRRMDSSIPSPAGESES